MSNTKFSCKVALTSGVRGIQERMEFGRSKSLPELLESLPIKEKERVVENDAGKAKDREREKIDDRNVRCINCEENQ